VRDKKQLPLTKEGIMKAEVEFQEFNKGLNKMLWLLALVCFLIGGVLGFAIARAEEIDVDKLATAIYHAENSKSHPYGILAHYKTTTPRQACINTINHALKDWNGQGDFIEFLGSRYCPLTIKGEYYLNKNWVRNVKYYLKHS